MTARSFEWKNHCRCASRGTFPRTCISNDFCWLRAADDLEHKTESVSYHCNAPMRSLHGQYTHQLCWFCLESISRKNQTTQFMNANVLMRISPQELSIKVGMRFVWNVIGSSPASNRISGRPWTVEFTRPFAWGASATVEGHDGQVNRSKRSGWRSKEPKRMPSKEVIQCHQITYDVQNQDLILAHTKVRFDLISVFTRFHAVLRYSGATRITPFPRTDLKKHVKS